MASYQHYARLPFSHEPLKTIYVIQRVLTTVLLVPFWIIRYLPRSKRPRRSWSLRQVINVKFTRRVYRVTEVAGVTWSTRDPTQGPNEKKLKETRFAWAEPLDESLRTGAVVSEPVKCKRVGMYMWPKTAPILEEQSDVEKLTPPLIGIFMHGGGYCHMSAHESTRTSRIPRGLMKIGAFSEIYAVEYRLLQHEPFPAVLQDAAAVYVEVLRRYKEAGGCKSVLIGDSSGGNLALMLMRWIRDEGKLQAPHGLLLLSPSCDISHAFPINPTYYVPRPHDDTDYLIDTPEPRALLQRTFLGFKIRHQPPLFLSDTELKEMDLERKRLLEIVNWEYISPASPRVLRRYGHPVIRDMGGEDVRHLEETAPVDPQLEQRVEANVSGHDKKHCLFSSFPRTLIVVGDAERLEHEVRNLISAMERDGTDVETMWVKDAVHDVLMMAPGWWDEKMKGEIWERISEWISGFAMQDDSTASVQQVDLP